MESTVQTVTTQTVTPVPSHSHKCVRGGCKNIVVFGTGYLPSIEEMMRKEYGESTGHSQVLTAEQLAKYEYCRFCARLATFTLYPTLAACAIMERRIETIELARERAARDGGFMNREFASLETRKAPHSKKHHRLGRKERRALAQEPRASKQSLQSKPPKPAKQGGNGRQKGR